MPNPHNPFILETDVSKVTTGAVLRQYNNNGFLNSCEYISQSLNSTEKNYEIYDRELLAIIRELKTWKHYLVGSSHPVTIWCDHQNLTCWKHKDSHLVKLNSIFSLHSLSYMFQAQK